MTSWTHATNSRKKFQDAVSNSSLSAIECDVLMSNDHSNTSEPILAHPPARDGDLTVAMMFQLILGPKEEGGEKNLRKHLKLDFKEISALEPTLDLLYDSYFTNQFRNEIILNADILAGPGFSANDPSIVPACEFLPICLDYIRRLKTKNSELLFGLSLGFKCNWQTEEGYLKFQVSQMSEILHKYQLAVSNQLGIRIILALNARQLVKSLPVFDEFLREHPESNILAWTGSGEPPIPIAQVDQIREHYKSKQMESIIEFDCCTTSE
eukprot:CAMPEP_0172403250 /NCGR_PEP_ID=MMETSP1061-20121228/58442_1 /TAXON_ID=37318 /ORGANISM="Pseudo-nitzschia pungens, Strain cf. pungens" /LENGTH=266 /DNA_ID=CAMNT_0013137585 /DNA_START=9 /DNA_END=809 /DNA_ORIENTATION=+